MSTWSALPLLGLCRSFNALPWISLQRVNIGLLRCPPVMHRVLPGTCHITHFCCMQQVLSITKATVNDAFLHVQRPEGRSEAHWQKNALAGALHCRFGPSSNARPWPASAHAMSLCDWVQDDSHPCQVEAQQPYSCVVLRKQKGQGLEGIEEGVVAAP